jgi:Flp pilus assembly protein TadB
MTDLINKERTGQPLTDRSTADLVKLASEQISHLVRDELRLAQAELARKGKHAGIGIGLFGGAGVLALYAVAGLFATAVLALALVLPAWLACLIVTVALLAVAGLIALVGRIQVKRAASPVPEQTVDSLKEDIGAVAEALRERGHR